MSGRYGKQWYLHRDGVPPEDDDNDYVWTGSSWSRDFEREEAADDLDADAIDEAEERRRRKIAERNEY